MTYEIRSADLWPDVDFEMRAAPDGFTFEGYAAVYDKPSVRMAFSGINGGRPFRELISPGAFSKTLSEKPDVRLLYNHEPGIPLARTKSGTMVLTDDAVGLRVRADLPDNANGQVLRDAIARGDVSGMSFRFAKVRDSFASQNGEHLRTLAEVRLGTEVSVTDFPAYPDTIATVRALAEEAEVDPAQLIEALGALKPEARLTAEHRDTLIAVVNAHSDAPVVDSAAVAKLAQMRERLAATRG